MSKIPLRRIPKILAEELNAAIRATQMLDHTEVMRLLRIHRDNRRKAIAAWGLSNIGATVLGLSAMPLEHLDPIHRLDEAFQKLYRYKTGGACDYVGKDVERVINSYRRSGQEGRNADYSEIINFLDKRGYRQSDNKKALEIAAKEIFEVSHRTVQRAAQKGGLTRSKRESNAK